MVFSDVKTHPTTYFAPDNDKRRRADAKSGSEETTHSSQVSGIDRGPLGMENGGPWGRASKWHEIEIGQAKVRSFGVTFRR